MNLLDLCTSGGILGMCRLRSLHLTSTRKAFRRSHKGRQADNEVPNSRSQIAMSESLTIPTGTKEDIYRQLLPQIESLVEETDDLIANLANIAAILKQVFDF